MNTTQPHITEKVSIIVPTYGRQELYPLLFDCFVNQDYPDIELLVYDDSPIRSDFFNERPKVRYFHSSKRLTIGAKRNFLVEQATGSVIVHFDDDDYYTPEYVSYMTAHLQEADLVKLSSWFLFGISQNILACWDTSQDAAIHYVVGNDKPLTVINGTPCNNKFLLGFGFSYVYRKSTWESVRFPDQNHGEDYAWLTALIKNKKNIRLIPDSQGLVLHILHNSNTSKVYPQHHIPRVLLERLFGTAVLKYIKK